MKKKVILLILAILASYIYSESFTPVELKVKYKTKLWSVENSVLTETNYDFEIDKDVIVKGYEASHVIYNDSYIGEYKDVNNFYNKILYNDKLYYIESTSLVPLHSKFSFEDCMISSRESKMLVPLYFVESIYNKDKSIILNKEKQYKYMNDWFSRDNVHFNGALIIKQSSITFNHLLSYGYFIKNINRINDIYEINIIKDSSFFEKESLRSLGWEIEIFNSLPFYSISGETLYLKKDGDFLYISSDNFNSYDTYCYVDKDFVCSLILFLNESNNVKNKLSYPRHADGTCDYEANGKSSSAKTVSTSTNVAVKKTMTTNCNLKLRSGEATSTQVLTVMSAGTKVKILELGKAETIDGINSNWVKVEVQSGAKDRDGKEIKAGTVGWCYGGYLQ